MKCCVKFSNMTSILLPAMPGAALSAVSDYNLSILQLQVLFQRCLRGVPPVVSAILDDLPSMYANMSLDNVFKHIVICGIDGCYMCRSTEQWAEVLPLSIYEHYLNVFKHQDSAKIITPADLHNFIKLNTDFRDRDRHSMYNFIRKYTYSHGHKYITQRLISSDCTCHYKDGIEYQPHDYVDAHCTIDILMAAMFAIQTRIFSNLFVFPYYLSLHMEHMHVVTKLGNSCEKIDLGGFQIVFLL